MKKYLFLIILTFLLFGIISNIGDIEKSRAYSVSNVILSEKNIEKTVVCTGTIYKTPQEDIFAKIYINENLVSAVQKQQKAKIIVNALDGVAFTGTVIALADEATIIKVGSVSQTVVEGVVKLDQATETKYLRNGYTVSVHIIVKTKENALIVPYNAVLYNNEEKYVYKIVDNWAVKTEIHVTEETEKGVVVQGQGLSAGDRVVSDLEQIPKDKKFVRYEEQWETEQVG